jgi:alpha-beta hydrolase superfamily lysophospholipase
MVELDSLCISFRDRYEGYARFWLPASPRGAVLYLHGIQSHGLWFEGSARRLAEAGFAVLLPDRRGSGRNEVERGHTRSARQLLRDAADCLNQLHVRTGFNRFHIVGVSWGGKLALALLGYLPARVMSLSLVAPGLFPKVDLPLLRKVQVAWSAITDGRAMFDIPLNDPELFTANRERQGFIRNDTLALHKVTARFLLASRRLDRLALAAARDCAGCPLRLFLAGEDRIIDNHRTKAFVRGLLWPQREITEYPNAHHTLEFEPGTELFFDDLVAWLCSTPAEVLEEGNTGNLG